MTAKKKAAPPKAPKRVQVTIEVFEKDNATLRGEAPWTINPTIAPHSACAAFVARLSELVSVAGALDHAVLVVRDDDDKRLTVSLLPYAITANAEPRDDA